MNNSNANTTILAEDVMKNRNNNHVDKYDLGKVKAGLQKVGMPQNPGRHIPWRRPPVKVRVRRDLGGDFCGGFLQTFSSILHE